MKKIQILLYILGAGILFYWVQYFDHPHLRGLSKGNSVRIDSLWHAPDSSGIANLPDADLIIYGRELIRNTSFYIGPKGSVGNFSNGMNCQNCHLDAGTRPWGNNYSSVYATYPKIRARSGKMENIPKRVNDCVERSLNGIALDTNGKEMNAIVSYIKWLGIGVEKGKKTAGSGITELAYLNRAADPQKGKLIYQEKCQSCHQPEGKGVPNAAGTGFFYPPLWGEQSYNSGAGLFRISRLAGYVKSNMPWGATHDAAQLSDEQAWDVAAFINSQPRPGRDLSNDWPDVSGKPVDHPFGPFADGFSENQHKYGPFQPIKDWKESHKKK
jgi:thiosulfate dehydrogenase